MPAPVFEEADHADDVEFVVLDDRVEHPLVAGAEEAEVPVGDLGAGDVLGRAGHAQDLQIRLSNLGDI